MNIGMLYDQYEPWIIQLRRWFHQHPELSLQEQNTSLRIQEELSLLGIPLQVLEPNYGIAAVIKGKGEGKTIVLRADMDALPVQEETGLPFASENQGVMHACGHDAHVAMLLGTARVLNELRSEWSGTVICIFQAGEETGDGHEEVLEYLKTIGKVDAVIGLHIWSAIPEGDILLLPDAIFAGTKGYNVKITGQGGHGARPDFVKDPIKAACEMVLKFASIPSNFYDVLDHSVVTVGKLHAGSIANVFPSEACFGGSIRWFKRDGDKKILEKMHQIARGVCQIYGTEYELEIPGGVPAVMNDREMIDVARKLTADVLGLRISTQTDPICAGDNFAYLLEEYRGFYGILGGGKKEEVVYPQHHCKFDVDEKAFRKGAEFMTRFVVDFLDEHDKI